jgi:hypothetical protein
MVKPELREVVKSLNKAAEELAMAHVQLMLMKHSRTREVARLKVKLNGIIRNLIS